MLTIHIGNTGALMGNAVWKIMKNEHTDEQSRGIFFTAYLFYLAVNYIRPMRFLTPFIAESGMYSETDNGYCRPRCIYADTENITEDSSPFSSENEMMDYQRITRKKMHQNL